MTDWMEQAGGTTRGTRGASREVEPVVLDALRECEFKIDRAYDDAWHALKRIHDEELYKADRYKSFKEYVEQRWGMSKSRAHRLIDHVKIVEYLKTQGVEALPTSEAHTNALTKLRRISKGEDDFLQRAGNAWEMAVDTAPKQFDVPRVTASHIDSSMQHFGVYRNVKRKNPDEEADELREALARVSQCAALKKTPESAAAKFGKKAYPSKFHETLTWLNAFATACGGETD